MCGASALDLFIIMILAFLFVGPERVGRLVGQLWHRDGRH
jgi:hypothetical protein